MLADETLSPESAARRAAAARKRRKNRDRMPLSPRMRTKVQNGVLLTLLIIFCFVIAYYIGHHDFSPRIDG
jgi:hypothetical protein